uniref:Uncharacterized protein n=1 Tax=Aegilops tauschii subsp. strangulata TaxID=200361 RepID=A0A453EAJ0_AEGTS
MRKFHNRFDDDVTQIGRLQNHLNCCCYYATLCSFFCSSLITTHPNPHNVPTEY